MSESFMVKRRLRPRVKTPRTEYKGRTTVPQPSEGYVQRNTFANNSDLETKQHKNSPKNISPPNEDPAPVMLRSSLKSPCMVYKGFPKSDGTNNTRPSQGYVQGKPHAKNPGFQIKRARVLLKKYSPSNLDTTLRRSQPVSGIKQPFVQLRRIPSSSHNATVYSTESDSGPEWYHNRPTNLPLSSIQDATICSTQSGSGNNMGKNICTQVLPATVQSSIEAQDKADYGLDREPTTLLHSETDQTGEDDTGAEIPIYPETNLEQVKRPAMEIEQEKQTNDFLQKDNARAEEVDSSLVQNTSTVRKLPTGFFPRVSLVQIDQTRKANDICNVRQCANANTTENNENPADVEDNNIDPRNIALHEATNNCGNDSILQDSVTATEETGENVSTEVLNVPEKCSQQRKTRKVTAVEQPNAQSFGRVVENLVNYFIKHNEEEKRHNQQEVEEDKAFLMSILSSVKQLSPSRKLDFRMDVLSALKKNGGGNL